MDHAPLAPPPPRRRLHRGGVFGRLAGGLVLLGLLIGVVFPYFTILLGVPDRYVLDPAFRASCVGAGLGLAGSCWWIARVVVGRRLALLAARLGAVSSDLRAASADGRWEPGSATGHTLPADADDDLGRTAGAFNELLVTLEAEHVFRSMVQSSADITVLVDTGGCVTFVSSSVVGLLGWPPESIVGRRLAELIHPGDAETVRGVLGGRPGGGRAGAPVQPVLVRVRDTDGVTRSLELVGSDRRGDARVGALVLNGRDVTERRALEAQLAHRASHDELTGLPNRAHLLDRGSAHLREHPAGEGAGGLAVLMLDLNRFKEVNDTLGHSYGDRLLEQIGPRLRAHLRPDDLLARLGGDEFAVLMPGVDHETALGAATRMGSAFTDPFLVAGLELDVAASIGVAVRGPAGGPPAGDSIEDLLRRADVAMYTAKELQTGVELYSPSTDRHDRSRLVMLTQFRRGLADGDLVLHFQPKVDLVSRGLVGVEALVRWQHPTRGLLPPGDFLPLVEATGLIHDLTLTVLDLALTQAAAWADQGRPLEVAVNLSARSLHDRGLPALVARLLERHGVSPRLLRLEVTESAVMADPATALEVLQALRALGLGLSLDDFGTGYSSLSHLKHLPVDELKVDRSFVSGLLTSGEDRALVQSAIDLGHTLGMSVVAEGVELGHAVDALAGLRCDTGQGFWFARPQVAADLDRWLAEHHPTAPVPGPEDVQLLAP